MIPLDFPEWHVENCKNVVVVYDGGFRCTDNLSCIHAYAEYRVREANRWRKWPEEKPMIEEDFLVVFGASGGRALKPEIRRFHAWGWYLHDWEKLSKMKVLAWQPLPEYKEQP